MHDNVGRYRIISELGRGAMGTVFRAEDTMIGRIVALKTVPKPGPTSPPREHETFARFLREARAAGRLVHTNVVTVFDVGEDATAGLSYIAMELVEGEPLDRRLRDGQRLSYDDVRSIGAQVASALAAAHRAGVVHRDIKPANLILTPSGVVKVTDFGVAKMADAAVTHDGTLIGSPSYMSPEQVRASDVDYRSDFFSLGTVLYELCTGRPAFPGRNVYEVITKVSKGDLIPLREVCPDVPELLERAIHRAMELAKEDRFASATDMARALDDGGELAAIRVERRASQPSIPAPDGNLLVPSEHGPATLILESSPPLPSGAAVAAAEAPLAPVSATRVDPLPAASTNRGRVPADKPRAARRAEKQGAVAPAEKPPADGAAEPKAAGKAASERPVKTEPAGARSGTGRVRAKLIVPMEPTAADGPETIPLDTRQAGSDALKAALAAGDGPVTGPVDTGGPGAEVLSAALARSDGAPASDVPGKGARSGRAAERQSQPWHTVDQDGPTAEFLDTGVPVGVPLVADGAADGAPDGAAADLLDIGARAASAPGLGGTGDGPAPDPGAPMADAALSRGFAAGAGQAHVARNAGIVVALLAAVLLGLLVVQRQLARPSGAEVATTGASPEPSRPEVVTAGMPLVTPVPLITPEMTPASDGRPLASPASAEPPSPTPAPASTAGQAVASPAAPAQRPVRTAAPRPRPTEAPREVLPVVVATPEERPAATPGLLPYHLRVAHNHRTGSCQGTLIIEDDRLIFDSSGDPEEDRRWPWSQLRKLRVGDGVLEVSTRESEGITFGLRGKRYRFRIEGPLPADVRETLRQRVRD